MKKIICLCLFVVLLLGVLAACANNGEVNNPEEPDVATTTTTTTGTTEELPTVTLEPRENGELQASDLESFFQRHQAAMTALAESLLALDISRATIVGAAEMISSSDERGDELPLSNELREKLTEYFAIARDETDYLADIRLDVQDDRRMVIFDFRQLDANAQIVYMPDGYVERTLYVEIDYPEPAMLRIDMGESNLTDNWYSYAW